PHPLLHTFPTRRSSDLALQARAQHGPPVLADIRLIFALLHAEEVEEFPLLLIRDRRKPERKPVVRDGDSIGDPVDFHFGTTASQDRKSTRLNSSHLVIS